MENNDNLNSLFDKLFKLVEDPKEKAKMGRAFSVIVILCAFFAFMVLVPDLDEKKFKTVILSTIVLVFVVLVSDILITGNILYKIICFLLLAVSLLIYFNDAATILNYWNTFFPKGSSFPYEILVFIFVFFSLLYFYSISQKNNNDGQ